MKYTIDEILRDADQCVKLAACGDSDNFSKASELIQRARERILLAETKAVVKDDPASDDKADLLSMAALIGRLGREQQHRIPAELLKRASAALVKLSDEQIGHNEAAAVSMRVTNAVLKALKASDFSEACPGTMDLLERRYKATIGQGAMSVLQGLKKAKK